MSYILGATTSEPRLCVVNAFQGATYSATELIGGAAVNCATMETYNRATVKMYPIGSVLAEMSGLVPINYIAVFYKASRGTLGVIQYYNGTSWVQFNVPIDEGQNALVLTFDSNVWASKIQVSGNNTFSPNPGEFEVINFKAGIGIQFPTGMPPGYAPSKYNPQDEMQNDWSIGGQILGTQLERSGISEQLKFQYLNPAWVSSNIANLQAYFRAEAAYFAWDPKNHPTHCVYAALDGRVSIQYDSTMSMSVELSLRGPQHG